MKTELNMEKECYIICYKNEVFHSVLHFLPGNRRRLTYPGLCFIRGGSMGICKPDWLASVSGKTQIKKVALTVTIVEITEGLKDIHFTAINEWAKKGWKNDAIIRCRKEK